MLHVKNVSKKVGHLLLQDISFHLPEGYIMGLIGPNGAGKTSLLHMILGLNSPEQGTIEIEGRDFKDYERENKEVIGYVLAERLFNYKYSLKKIASYYGQFYKDYDDSLFESYAQRFELDITKKGSKLSKGENIKFQYAFALSHRPKLLVLDEPTGNFDPEFRKIFLKTMSEFVADGKHSILLTTHLTKELDRLADYITFIHKGKLIFSKDKETLMEEYRLVSGENYKINLLRKDRVIYKEVGQYGTKALVKGDRFEAYDAALDLKIPNLEEIMYFTIKGEKECVR
ncbi:MAG: ABC transporter ATP-binding protein [Cellulosilyticum sp.]|nr:ABC transporter ATP-binding protein [Cellulosilyticum sp.]MEE1071342.1 ABC transporter ATP-binding protein [Cellulosilyticum sp.]